MKELLYHTFIENQSKNHFFFNELLKIYVRFDFKVSPDSTVYI